MKTHVIISICLLLLISFLSFTFILFFNSEKVNHSQFYTYTKAICDEKYCQDYTIVCQNKKLVSSSPITGASVLIPKNWKDPRINSQKFCD